MPCRWELGTAAHRCPSIVGLTEGEAERVCGVWLDFYWCGSSSG